MGVTGAAPTVSAWACACADLALGLVKHQNTNLPAPFQVGVENVVIWWITTYHEERDRCAMASLHMQAVA